MIEIVKEPIPIEEAGKIPRNIRQIGNVSGNSLLYMEDYVYRFLHKKDRKTTKCSFVFLGEIVSTADRHYIYIKGALELSEISYGGGLPVFSEDVWDEIYRQSRQFFPQWRIVGWGLQTVGTKQDMEKELSKICERHFPKNHGNVYLYDAYGEWEQMYLDLDGRLRLQEGYCIYYEKNASMSHYLSTYHTKKEQEQKREKDRAWEGFLIHDESRYEKANRQDAEAMARYRAYVNGQQQYSHRQRGKVAISIAVVVMMLLSGVLIQNYAKLSDMQETVEVLSNQEAVTQAQEDVIKETISKKASELSQSKQVQNEKESDAENETESAVTEQNPYLAQGYYIVEKGDKLTDISKKVYGEENMVQAICEKNDIEDIDKIQAGDKLLLP